jgi:hypothetical protein
LIVKFDESRKEGFADSETGTGFTLAREFVRHPSTSFALLTSVEMTERLRTKKFTSSKNDLEESKLNG